MVLIFMTGTTITLRPNLLNTVIGFDERCCRAILFTRLTFLRLAMEIESCHVDGSHMLKAVFSC